jgi:hypothetical protein
VETSPSRGIHQPALDALGRTESQHSLASFRSWQVKGMVEKIPHSRHYRLVGKGYSICLVFLKRFEKVYALSLLAYCHRSVETAFCQKKNAVYSTASTNTSAGLDALLRAIGLNIAA